MTDSYDECEHEEFDLIEDYEGDYGRCYECGEEFDV